MRDYKNLLVNKKKKSTGKEINAFLKRSRELELQEKNFRHKILADQKRNS